MELPVAWYREFVPSPPLRAHVYALFSFVEGSATAAASRLVIREVAFTNARFISPQFADGHASMVFELGQTCRADGRWRTNPRRPQGTLIGPLSRVGRIEGNDRNEMIGAYFRPARVAPFVPCPVADLTNTSVSVDDAWSAEWAQLAAEMCGLDEGQRIDRLEAVLLARLDAARQTPRAVDVEGLARAVRRRRGRVGVEELARAAGISRQHLSRLFRQSLGVSPKLYARLARFQAGLAYAGRRADIDWAQAALDAGYADQSHMIAEFRGFSGLTPHELAHGEWFHPFIERARAPVRSSLGG